MCASWAVIPTIGVIQLGKVVQKLFMILAEVINDTALVLEGSQVGLSSLATVVTCGRIALDVFLTGQGGVCAISITYFGVWISALGQVERSIQKLKKKST